MTLQCRTWTSHSSVRRMSCHVLLCTNQDLKIWSNQSLLVTIMQSFWVIQSPQKLYQKMCWFFSIKIFTLIFGLFSREYIVVQRHEKIIFMGYEHTWGPQYKTKETWLRVGGRARVSGGINARVTSDSALIRSRLETGGQLRLLLNFWNWKVNLYLLHYLTAAVIRRGDTHCRVFMFCNADLSWRGNVLYFMNVMLQRGEEKRATVIVIRVIVCGPWSICHL